ncbi:hypothetical protein [Anaerophilus nitritogenes]|uniref:hypothetical protein n=1 Tax=Anaerophilus nitritogenes TaxID=2498136 RepID=UPI00101CC0A7|nr:hypothetical protein [Anaerophilus nitritogenes]
MNHLILYFEKFLKALGFKKFMWMHTLGFTILALMLLVGLVETFIKGTFDSLEARIAFAGLALIYICIRVFQAVFERKVIEDRYMFLWLGNKKNKNN